MSFCDLSSAVLPRCGRCAWWRGERYRNTAGKTVSYSIKGDCSNPAAPVASSGRLSTISMARTALSSRPERCRGWRAGPGCESVSDRRRRRAARPRHAQIRDGRCVTAISAQSTHTAPVFAPMFALAQVNTTRFEATRAACDISSRSGTRDVAQEAGEFELGSRPR